MSWRAALETRVAEALLAWRARPDRVRRAVARAARRPAVPEAEVSVSAGAAPAAPWVAAEGGSGGSGRHPGRRLRAAAVQMRLVLHRSAEAYAEHVFRLARQAARAGAELVCFPEDAATHLLGLLPGVDRLLGSGSLEEAVRRAGAGRVADIFRFVGPAAERVYDHTFSQTARRLGIWIAAGSANLPDATGAVKNQARLYGPDGRLVATQDKCHLLPMEAGWGLEPGDTLAAVPAGRAVLGLPVCMDASYFETFRILTALGAEVIVLPTANPEPFHFWEALRGAWGRVQESPAYAVNACLVGEVLGLVIQGHSAIYAPLALTPNLDGVLVRAATATEEEIVVADLDLDALAAYRRRHPPPANPELYRRAFPGIYDRAAGLAAPPGG